MSAGESDLEQMTCIVQGRDAVSKASDAARSFGEQQWLGEDELARLCIVIEEVISNLYDHGGVKETDKVEVTLQCEPAGISVVIVDCGTPFDPHPTPSGPAWPNPSGSEGIELVRAWVEFVSYGQTADGNRLEMLLPIHWDG